LHSAIAFLLKSMLTAEKIYVTHKGLEKVQKEYKRLLEFRNQKTRGEVPSMLHSEEANPEYLAFQEDMNMLETKLAEYEDILQKAEIIKKPPKGRDILVDLGALVALEMDGKVEEFLIVGTLEADPLQKKISNESPIGKALLGKREGDLVSVETAVVTHTCKILTISYL